MDVGEIGYPIADFKPDVGLMMKVNSRVRINGGTTDMTPYPSDADIGYEMASNAMSELDMGFPSGQLPIRDLQAEMKDNLYNPSMLGSGRVLIVPANYGEYGSQLNEAFNSEPVKLGINGYTDPHVPTWNNLIPINWNVYVVNTDEQTALAQVGLTQVATSLPVTFQQPATASLIAYA